MTTTTIGGAIRWDYQYQGPGGGGGTSTALKELYTLETAQFRGRAPVHFSPTGNNTGLWGDNQSTFDAEIAAAVSAGLKYWAFFRQSVGSSVHDPNGCFGLNYYQASTKKNLVNWCSIFGIGLLGSTGNYSTQVASIVTECLQTNYQKCFSNRPVIYLYWSASDLTNYWGGSVSNFTPFVAALRTACVAAGLGTPYLIVMNGLDISVMNTIGADAIGGYNAPWPWGLSVPWSTYEPQVEADWAAKAALGVPIVPTAMTGLDQRPRLIRPVFTSGATPPYFGLNQYAVAPTASQITSHLSAAVSYIAANPAACPSSLLLIYAWNEHSENGNVLNPTLDDPNGTRCAAAGAALIGN